MRVPVSICSELQLFRQDGKEAHPLGAVAGPNYVQGMLQDGNLVLIDLPGRGD